MNLKDELKLLLKSQHPLIYLETVDEEYSFDKVMTAADELDYVPYEWSSTRGLGSAYRGAKLYDNATQDPALMLRRLLEMTSQYTIQPSVYILRDVQKYLDKPTTLRNFKDLLNAVRPLQKSVVILASEYSLPQEIASDCMRVKSGYPDESEIKIICDAVIREIKRLEPHIRVELAPAQYLQVVKLLKGLSIQQIHNVINQVVHRDNKFDASDIKLIEEYKRKIFDQDGLLEFCCSIQDDEISGFVNLKRWLMQRKNVFFENRNNLPLPKGILLMGVQGCGKSLAVKMAAGVLGLPMYRLDISKLYSKYIGETEENLRKTFHIIEKLSPLCLWIDEIEKVFSSSSGDIDGGVSQRILGTFLTWMQERQDSSFIAATANNIRQIPPEFLRKGRLDEVFFVDLPTDEERKAIFQIHFKKRSLNSEVFDLQALVSATPNFNGAEIEQALISALYACAAMGCDMTTQAILEQTQMTRPLAVMRREDIAELRAWADGRTVPV